MIQVSTVRRLLAAADVARDPYAVAEAAAALASANTDDAFARLHYVRALMALGLGTAARSVAATIPPEQFPEPVRQQMLAAPAGLTAWASRARRFRANAAALLERYPEYEPMLAQWEQASSRYELHLASDTNAFVRDTTVLPLWRGWLRTLGDHRAANSAWSFDNKQNPTPSPLAFDGIGYGWLLPHVLATTANSYLSYSCAVYIVEPDPVAMCMVMHLHDMQAIFAAPRVRVFLGADALAKLRASFDTHPEWSPPAHVIVLPLTRAAVNLQPVCESILANRSAQRAAIKQQVDAYYADKDPYFWSERFAEAAAGGPPLRVLGLTTRYSTVLQYSMEEMRRAVMAEGNYEMQVAMESDDHSAESPFMQMMADFKPDLIFQISRMRYENADIPKTVPFLCWDQDNLSCMRTEAATGSLDSLTYVAGHGANFGYSHLNWNRRNVIFCHPAGATFKYAPAVIGPSEQAQYACDVSYVSNASELPEALTARLRRRWESSPLATLYDQSMAAVHAASFEGRVWDYLALQTLAAETALESEVALSVSHLRELTMDMHTLADRCFRHATLEWASRWCLANGKTLAIYGQGWDTHRTLAGHARGPAKPGAEMRAIYQTSKINLQIIEAGFLHSRALDGLAAGGFFLTRQTANDGLGSPEIADTYELARWCHEHSTWSVEAMANSSEPRVRTLLKSVQEYFQSHGVSYVISKALETWACIPPAAFAIPQISSISFSTEQEFAALAKRYLSDEACRRSLAAEMRAVVLRDFSYTARWRQFMEGVTKGLLSETPVPLLAAR